MHWNSNSGRGSAAGALCTRLLLRLLATCSAQLSRSCAPRVRRPTSESTCKFFCCSGCSTTSTPTAASTSHQRLPRQRKPQRLAAPSGSSSLRSSCSQRSAGGTSSGRATSRISSGAGLSARRLSGSPKKRLSSMGQPPRPGRVTDRAPDRGPGSVVRAAGRGRLSSSKATGGTVAAAAAAVLHAPTVLAALTSRAAAAGSHPGSRASSKQPSPPLLTPQLPGSAPQCAPL